MGWLVLVSFVLCRNSGRHDRRDSQEISRTGARLMIKAFKYRLYPNKATEKKLHWTLTRCRELYNAALSERKDAYQQFGRTIVLEGLERTVAATMVAGFSVKPMSFFGQKRDLSDIKSERTEYQEIVSHVLQDG